MSLVKIIVPDDVLDVQICDNCHKYLSAKPVKVGKGKILCGRCVDEENDGYVKSLYGFFAEYALFKCVNHFDGCNIFLPYDTVIDHERHCKNENYECLLCPETSSKLPTYKLPYHVKTKHRKAFLKKNSFTVELIHLKMNVFFYRIDNYLFFIKESYNSNNKFISLHVVGVGKKNQYLKINIKYLIKFQDGSIFQFESYTLNNNAKFDRSSNNFNFIIDNAKENQLMTVHFEIEIPSCTQLIYIDSNLPKLKDKNVMTDLASDTCQLTTKKDSKDLSMSHLIQTKLTSLNDELNGTCSWSRLLRFNPLEPPEDGSHVSISSCKTRLIVNQFANSMVETFSICFHCILCKCICKDITDNFVFKYGSYRHLVCISCAKLFKNIIQLVPLRSVISIEIFSSLQYSCIKRCRIYSFPFNNSIIFKHYESTLFSEKSCCMANCKFIAKSVSSLIDHFLLCHNKILQFLSENNLAHLPINMDINETCSKIYILQYDVIIEVVLQKILSLEPEVGPRLPQKYLLSAKICDKFKANLNLLMHILDITGGKKNILGTFFNTAFIIDHGIDRLAVRCFVL